jgi:hypothetical protein
MKAPHKRYHDDPAAQAHQAAEGAGHQTDNYADHLNKFPSLVCPDFFKGRIASPVNPEV